MKKIIKLLIVLTCFIWAISSINFADDISIIPEWSTDNAWQKVKEVSVWWQVWKNYRDIVNSWNLSLWDKFASGIMSRDTILDYVVYLIEFLSWIGLLIGAVAIIYVWYDKLALQYFKWTPKWVIAVIIWVIVLSFSYAIIKALRSAFVS